MMFLFSFLERKAAFVVVAMVLWALLETGYRVFVSPLYGYAGFGFNFSFLKYFEALFIYMVLVYSSPHCLNRPSDFLLVFLLFGLVLPLLILYGLDDRSREHLYIVVMGYVLIDLFRRGSFLRIPFVRNGFYICYFSLVLIVCCVTVWLFVSGGYQYFNIDMSRVYDFRRDAGQLINSGFMGYVNVWVYKVFGPALVAIGLWKKKWFLVVMLFFLSFIWFGISNHKSVLFYPVLIVFLWAFFRNSRAISILPLGMSCVVFFSLFLFVFMEQSFVSSMFLRRAFFVIANNVFDYYSFFDSHVFVYWSSSILSSYINYPYDLNPPELIGNWRGTDSHVNNSFLSTGFMHAGIAGVVVYCILCGLLFRLVDSLSNASVPVWVALSIILVPSRSLLLSADLPTALLTHGIAVAVLVLFLIRSANGYKANNCSASYVCSSKV